VLFIFLWLLLIPKIHPVSAQPEATETYRYQFRAFAFRNVSSALVLCETEKKLISPVSALCPKKGKPVSFL